MRVSGVQSASRRSAAFRELLSALLSFSFWIFFVFVSFRYFFFLVFVNENHTATEYTIAYVAECVSV